MLLGVDAEGRRAGDHDDVAAEAGGARAEVVGGGFDDQAGGAVLEGGRGFYSGRKVDDGVGDVALPQEMAGQFKVFEDR